MLKFQSVLVIFLSCLSLLAGDLNDNSKKRKREEKRFHRYVIPKNGCTIKFSDGNLEICTPEDISHYQETDENEPNDDQSLKTNNNNEPDINIEENKVNYQDIQNNINLLKIKTFKEIVEVLLRENDPNKNETARDILADFFKDIASGEPSMQLSAILDLLSGISHEEYNEFLAWYKDESVHGYYGPLIKNFLSILLSKNDQIVPIADKIKDLYRIYLDALNNLTTEEEKIIFIEYIARTSFDINSDIFLGRLLDAYQTISELNELADKIELYKSELSDQSSFDQIKLCTIKKEELMGKNVSFKRGVLRLLSKFHGLYLEGNKFCIGGVTNNLSEKNWNDMWFIRDMVLQAIARVFNRTERNKLVDDYDDQDYPLDDHTKFIIKNNISFKRYN